MMLKLVDLLNAATKICPISCITTEYVGKLQLMKDSYPGMTLYWHFESTDVQVYEEYLIYDVISAIGSVGGTLGMCIGFSFTGLISYIIQLIQYRIMIIKIKLTKQVFSKKASIEAESYEERECMERFRRSDNFQDKQIFDEKLNETNAKLKEHQKLIEGISKQVESIKVKINMI